MSVAGVSWKINIAVHHGVRNQALNDSQTIPIDVQSVNDGPMWSAYDMCASGYLGGRKFRKHENFATGMDRGEDYVTPLVVDEDSTLTWSGRYL